MFRRPSDRRAERARLATAGGVHELEMRADHALTAALATLTSAVRDGRGVRGPVSGVTQARDLFRTARTAERALTPSQRAQLVELRRAAADDSYDVAPASSPGLPE